MSFLCNIYILCDVDIILYVQKRLRDDVLLIATKVVWPFGEKRYIYFDDAIFELKVRCRVINRQTHLGLKGQWYMAGYDSSSGRNGQVWQTLSIILEDDMQVGIIWSCYHVLLA